MDTGSATGSAGGAAAIAAGQAIGITGKAMGGYQPIVGGTIQLYQVGTGTVAGASGYAANAIPLLTATVTTSDGKGTVATGNTGNANNSLPAGSFTLTGLYTCATGSELYITASGGSPDGSGRTNPNIALVAALGSCATLKASASTANIIVNEVSTVAAAYALAQFAKTSTFGTALSAQPGSSSSAPADNIATSSSNSQGVINAMAVAGVLANSVSLTGTPTGLAPGNNATSTATPEYWTLNTIADMLYYCVNSVPGAVSTAGDTSNCGTLYSDTANSSWTPSDTFQVALSLALYPAGTAALSGTTTGSNLTGLISGQTPFTPYVASGTAGNTVNDWTIAVNYTPMAPSGTTKTLINDPFSVAADAMGNVWVYSTNIANGRVTELNPIGDPVLAVASSSCTTTCVIASYDIENYLIASASKSVGNNAGGSTSPEYLAVDTKNNVWVNDRQNKNIFYITGSGTNSTLYVSGASPTNNGGNATGPTPAVGYALAGAGITGPVGLAVDGGNNPFFTETSSSAPDATCTQTAALTGGTQLLGTVQSSTASVVGAGGVGGGNIAIDAGDPSCTVSTTLFCNQTVLDQTTNGGTNTTITGAPFVWADYMQGQAGTVTPGTGTSTTSSTLGNYYTKATAGDIGCNTPLNMLASADSSVAPTTGIPAINTGTDPTEYLIKARALAFGPGNALWTTNDGVPDQNDSYQVSLSKITPTYGTAFTVASFLAATPSFNIYKVSGVGSPTAIAVDGSGNPWVSGTGSTEAVAELSASGTSISPSTGFLGTTTVYNSATLTRAVGQGAYSLAIDGTGNVWVPNTGNGTTTVSNNMYMIVGAATPAVAPLALGVKNGSLGMMP